MANYEAVLILSAGLEGEKLEGVTTDIHESIKSNGGAIIESAVMGKRRLAYPLRGQSEGVYYRVMFSIDPQNLDKVREANKMKDEVQRMMIVRESG